jgi:hypothetical protein
MKWVQESLNSVRASASATLQAEPISKEKEWWRYTRSKHYLWG